MAHSRKKNSLVAPLVKWAGGKRQLAPTLISLLPSQNNLNWCEPFAGGAAMLFTLQPSKALINDINEDLIGMYRIVKNGVDSLINELKKYKKGLRKESGLERVFSDKLKEDFV